MSKQHGGSMVISHGEAFAGPLPPPAAFEAYDRTLAGAADRILKMAEAEQAGRIELSKFQSKAAAAAKMRGLLFGLISVALLVGGAVACALKGATVAAGIFAGTTLAAVVRAFVVQGGDRK